MELRQNFQKTPPLRMTSSLLPFPGHLNIPGPPHSIESSLSSISVSSTSSDIVRHHKFDLTKCPAASIRTTTYHSALWTRKKISFPGPLSIQALDFTSKQTHITVKRTPIVYMRIQRHLHTCLSLFRCQTNICSGN